MKYSKSNNPLVWALVVTVYCIGCACVANAFGFEKLIGWLSLDQLKKVRLDLVDSSNDEAAHIDTHQLIERAGFSYENYWALADDGYVTQLIRIINPLADSSQLKYPPIMVQHGQTANSRNFVMQSNKQHHPMRWPHVDHIKNSLASLGGAHLQGAKRGSFNGIFENIAEKIAPSSNRSLAFMLANNGYDVWLTSTRGVDENNMGYVGIQAYKTVVERRNRGKNMTSGEDELILKKSRNYWSFTLDDQIAHEMPSQITTILNVTGASKVSVFGYSNTALTTFAMLASRPEFAAHVDTYIAAAPVVYYERLSGWFKWFMQDFMQVVPKSLDIALFMNEQMANFLRRVTVRICSNLVVRYTICKSLLDLTFGDSDQFNTNLELPFFGHLLRPTSWKCLAQHLQIVRTHRLAKFDYGPRRNMRYYNSRHPPEYDISKIDKNVNVVLVSGDKDSWATQPTVNEIRNRLPEKPVLDLVVAGYNHLDLAAAFDVDKKVNLPLLEFLDKRHEALMKAAQQESSIAEAEGLAEGQEDFEPQHDGLEQPMGFQLPNFNEIFHT